MSCFLIIVITGGSDGIGKEYAFQVRIIMLYFVVESVLIFLLCGSARTERTEHCLDSAIAG